MITLLRVLQCVAQMNRGGIETLLMNLCRSIDREQIQFDFLVGFDGEFDEQIRALGGRVFHLPFITQVGPFLYKKRLDAFFAAHPEYRIVHCHMDKFNGFVLKAAKQHGVPVRISHSHNTKNEGGLAFQLVKDHYGKLVLPNATDLFACGEAAADWMYGQRAAEAHIFKNGVDLTRFSPRDTRAAGEFTVGCVGRFTTMKNHTFALDVFAQVCRAEPRARLLLAGDGSLRGQLEEKVKHLHLQNNVTFLGVCKNVEDVLARLDVLCMPSLFEGFPVSLVEAQAVGVPCVVSDAITRESDICGEMQFLSLQQPPEVWANALLTQKGKPRSDNRQRLRQQGYDIRQTASELSAFYLAAEKRFAP